MSLEKNEQQIRERISNATVESEENIPFSSYSEFLNQVKEGKLRISSKYVGELVETLGGKSQNVMQGILVASPLIITVGLIILTFVLSNYWLLIGIALAFLGQILSNPGVMRGLGSLILGITFIYFLYSCYMGNWTGAVIAGSYAFSNFLTCVAREQCRGIIHDAIIRSEPTFIWLWREQVIIVERQGV